MQAHARHAAPLAHLAANVRHLDLQHSFIDVGTLSLLLRRMPSITALRVDRAGQIEATVTIASGARQLQVLSAPDDFQVGATACRWCSGAAAPYLMLYDSMR